MIQIYKKLFDKYISNLISKLINIQNSFISNFLILHHQSYHLLQDQDFY